MNLKNKKYLSLRKTRKSLLDYQQIGRIAKNKYVEAYGKAPSKHREVGANGKYFDVNDYYDAPMIQEAAREYMATRAPRIECPRVAKK